MSDAIAYATIRELGVRYRQRELSPVPHFVLYGEGLQRINTVPAYDVYYTRTVEGRLMFGRDVLLVAQRPGQRAGVEITMLTTPTANKDVTSPLEVATTGVLLRPYKTFTLH